MIGRTLAHYEILECVGVGGMGEVYRARDGRLDREIALKILPAGVAGDAERRERFEREAKAVAALNHPGIVTIHSIEDVDGVYFLTMELVAGRKLSELVRPEGLPGDELLAIGIGLADAVGSAHERGIVHRDLKPDNIMLTADGRMKVLDFGLAKLHADSGDLDEDRLDDATRTLDRFGTQMGKLLGTPAYMSPEQGSGRPVDPRSDVFSLGVILYELATGRRPFLGDSVITTISAILGHTPERVEMLRADLPRELGRIVETCLSKSPSGRYATARELRDALRAVQAGGGGPQAGDPQKSIAVLPFTNLSPDPENEYFADGMTEEIISALARLSDLRVAARTSSFALKAKAPTIAEVAAALRVATVLEGSVRRAGNRIRITAQLVNVSNGYQMWSERFDREMDDVFAVQDEIATAIARQLEVTLSGADRDALARRATENLEAYDLYLRGRYHLEQRGQGLRLALEYFQKAVELDPGFALAHAGLADTHTLLGMYGLVLPHDAMPRARTAARAAIALGHALAEAHTALAMSHVVYDWDLDAGEREFERAIEADPTYPLARYWFGMWVMGLGRADFEAGIALCRRAVEIDPLSAVTQVHLVMTLWFAKRMEEALAGARQVVARNPALFIGQWVLGNILLCLDQIDPARAALEKSASLSGNHAWPLASLGALHARAGRPEEARVILTDLTRRSRRQYVQPLIFAMIHQALREIDEAMVFIDRAIDEHDGLMLPLLRWPVTWDPLRADSRFDESLRRTGLIG